MQTCLAGLSQVGSRPCQGYGPSPPSEGRALLLPWSCGCNAGGGYALHADGLLQPRGGLVGSSRRGKGIPDRHRRMQCICGAMAPSRPHMTWTCASTADLRRDHPLPGTRAEERLFARPTPLKPKAPAATDPVHLSRIPWMLLFVMLYESQDCGTRDWIYIATDGSSRSSVGAFAVVVGTPSCVFSRGTAAEDQTPYRQEVMGLHAALDSLHRVWQPGCRPRVFLLTDCKAASHCHRGPDL